MANHLRRYEKSVIFKLLDEKSATELTVTIFRYVFDDEAPTARAVVYAVRSNLMHSQNTCFRSIRTQCAESSSKPLPGMMKMNCLFIDLLSLGPDER